MAAKKSNRLSREAFVKKPARTKEVEITVDGESATILLKAIGNKAYDKLLTDNPPTAEQKKAEEATYNPDTFAPSLIAAVVADPQITAEEAQEMYESDDWSRGELLNLFLECVQVCSDGLSSNPT